MSYCLRIVAIAFIGAHALCEDGHSQTALTKTLVSVSSTPAGGYVAVDGKYAGSTPMPAVEVTPGKHVITVRKEGFITATDTILAVVGETLSRQLHLDPAGELLVESEPPGAAVHVDERFRGTTPLRLPEMHEGRHAVVLTAPKHIRWADSVTVVLGTPITITARLQPIVGTISVEASVADVVISFDGRSAGSGPITGYSHPVGDVQITARERSTGDVAGGHFWVPPGGHLQVAAEFRTPTPETFRYSLLFPGLGQVLAGHGLKGGLYAAGFIVAGFLTLDANASYRVARDTYETSLASYRAADTRAGALEAHEATLAAYESVRSTNRDRTTYLAVAAGIYVISAVDALLFHSTENRIFAIEGSRTGPESGTGVPGGNGVQLCVRIPL